MNTIHEKERRDSRRGMHGAVVRELDSRKVVVPGIVEAINAAANCVPNCSDGASGGRMTSSSGIVGIGAPSAEFWVTGAEDGAAPPPPRGPYESERVLNRMNGSKGNFEASKTVGFAI